MELAKRDTTAEIAAPTGLRVAALRTVLVKGSTNKRFAAKKSTPSIGFETAAKMKEQRKEAGPKTNLFEIFPQEAMLLPSAPTRGGPEEDSEDLCGNTDTPAPVSTRNC